MRLRALWLGGMLVLGACATEANYQKILQAWVGHHQDELVAAWGPPDRTAALTNGGAVWEYRKRTESEGGGGTFYTYEPVTTTGTLWVDGQPGSYSDTSTVAVPHTSPTYTIVSECATRFTISPEGTIQSWVHEGNACVAEENQLWMRTPPPAAPAATASAAPSTSSTPVAQLAEAQAAVAREYPNAHIGITSVAPFTEKSETFDPYMPPYVQLSQVLDAGRYIVVSFLPMDLPVIEPEEYLTEVAEMNPAGQQAVMQEAVYETWRGLHSARAMGRAADGGPTLYTVRRVVWLEFSKGLLTLVGVAPSEKGAEDALGMLEEAIGIL